MDAEQGPGGRVIGGARMAPGPAPVVGGPPGEAPYLSFRRVVTPEDLEKVFRLRYQVYVVERGFERPEDHPAGIERDPFDEVAVHVLCEHRDGIPVGTARLIPPTPLGFPLEEHCRLDVDPTTLPRDRLGEISRLAISKEFQRRREDPFNPAPLEEGQAADTPAPAPGSAPPQRRRNDLVVGLYREIYRVTKERGLTHWYAAMEDKLMILLRRVGFNFQPIGPYVEYHGRRAPFVAAVADLERFARERAPEMYREFTAGLTVGPGGAASSA